VIGRSKDPAPTPEVEQPAVGKGRPTPKRKVAEAAHHRPLVVDDRRQATKNARAKQRAQRDLEYQAMLSGDERHMPARDAGPVKHFVRDYVDSRFNTGQYFLPIAVAFLLVSLITTRYPVAFFVLTGVLYLYVLVVLVDAIVLWFQLKKALVATFGPGAERGNLMYGVLRSTQLPRTRLPRPQVKRGGKPVTPKAPKA
jgi:hypothetical protein